MKLADIHQTMKQQHCEEVTSPEADTINASMLQSEDGEMMELVVSLPKKKIRLSEHNNYNLSSQHCMILIRREQ